MANFYMREQKKKICLIVEDSEVDQIKLSRVVQRSPFPMTPVVASSIEQARIALTTHQPALILLDNNLPDGLGANFAQELANNPRHARIPRMIISDWPSPFMWEKAASAGVSYVLSKSEFDGRYVYAAMSGKYDKTLRRPQVRAAGQI